MNINYKGKVIEWCTKNKLQCIFKTHKTNCNRYHAYLTIDGKTVKTSNSYTKKKLSEHAVSKLYLDGLPATENEFEINSLTGYYIDLENCADIDLNRFGSNFETIVSLGAVKNVLKRATIIVECTRSDAADVALIAILTRDILHNTYPQYAVISRDKLLMTAVEVLRELYQAKISIIIPH